MTSVALSRRRVRIEAAVLLSLGLIVALALNLALMSRLARWLERDESPLLPRATTLQRSPAPAAPPSTEPAPAAVVESPEPAPIPMPALTTTSAPSAGALALPASNWDASLTDLSSLPALSAPSTSGTQLATGAALDESNLDDPVRETANVQPVFPPRARRANVTDTVTVSFIVRADGSVSDLHRVSSKHPDLFEEPTFTSIRQSRFAAGKKGGQAVDARCTRTFHYVLPNH